MSFDSKTQGRSWFCTVNIQNMINLGLKKEDYERPEYVAQHFVSTWEKSGKGRKAGAAVCVSAKGLYHMHMACYGNTTTLKRVSDILGKCHVDPQMSGKKELTAYLEKTGKYAEKGEHVLYTIGLDNIEGKQGKRNDLDEIERMLEEGYTPDQIFQESFRYRRFEKMIKSEFLARKIRNMPLIKEMHNEWHFGGTGSGKTYTYVKLCETYSPEEVYLCNDYANSSSSGGGFDFYSENPAKIIILDEFRGEGIRYSTLLSLLDKYSRNQQHCRYQNTYALWESVIICSILAPEEVYSNMVSDNKKTDSFNQLMRRLDDIVYHYISATGEYKTFVMKASEYTCAMDMVRKAEQAEHPDSDGFIPIDGDDPFGD